MSKSISNMWLITGHARSDDDDTVHIVEGPAGIVCDLFIHQLRADHVDGHHAEIFITSIETLSAAIERRITA